MRARPLRAYLLGALLCSLAWAVACLLGPERGASAVVDVVPAAGRAPLARHVSTIDLGLLETIPGLSGSTCRVRWDGYWDVPAGGSYEISARARGALRVRLDGEDLLVRDGADAPRRERVRRAVAAGLRHLEVQHEAPCDGGALNLGWAAHGGVAQPFGSAALSPRPQPAWRRAVGRVLGPWGFLVALLWLTPLAAWSAGLAWTWIRTGQPPSVEAVPEAPVWLRPAARRLASLAPVLAIALVTLYGAALRFEALVVGFWKDAPGWALQISAGVRALRPEVLRWPVKEGFEGDPFSYLRYAREMVGFYDAHVREPLFVFTTRMFLLLTGQQDVAVGFASALFSALTVPALFLLGARAFSPWVGLGAAALYAVEPAVIRLSVEGWRDDAFTLFVVLVAYALLGLRERPTFSRALVAGVVGAAACLTRITSLSFLIPGYAALVLLPDGGSRRRRLEAAALAVAIGAVLVGPYLLSCAIAFGDPLHSINAHTRFYRARQELAFDSHMSWLTYLGTTLQPFELLDDLLVGLTTYPFSNKWEQLGFWSPFAASVLPWCAAAGLVLFATSATGRLLLVILLTSLLPYAFTWRVPGGGEWRFTLHAYPFYLLAACLCVAQALALVPVPRAREMFARLRLRRAVAVGLGALAVGLVGWWAWNGLYYLRLGEAVRAHRAVAFDAGTRDAFYFRSGWYPARPLGSVRVRFARGRHAELRLPLLAGNAYLLTLRIDPLAFEGAAPQSVALSLNGTPLETIALAWDPERIGTYSVRLPAAHVVAGRNLLALDAAWAVRGGEVQGVVQPIASDWQTGFLLWYVTVSP